MRPVLTVAALLVLFAAAPVSADIPVVELEGIIHAVSAGSYLGKIPAGWSLPLCIMSGSGAE